MKDTSALFGTILPSTGGQTAGYINGLRETNSSFLFALLRHTTLFKRFHFFTGDSDIQGQQLFWMRWLYDEGLSDSRQIIVFPIEYLPTSFSVDNYTLFYSGDPYLGQLLEMRRAFAGEPLPLVGRCHSLSQDVSLGAWRSVLHGESRPGDALLCSSEASRRVLSNLLVEAGERSGDQFQGELTLLPLGVDDCAIDLSKSAVRRMLQLPEQGTAILYFGRISPIDKADLQPLMVVLAELLDRYQHKDFYLIICGQASATDDYVGALAAQAAQLGVADRVFFKFDLTAEQKSLAYAAGDIFVSLADSVQESFGLAPVEAMSAGLPVVLSAWNGYRELMSHGREGFLIPTLWGDVDGLNAPSAFYDPVRANLVQAQSVAVDLPVLTQHLHQLLESATLRTTMAECGRRHFENTFAWPVIVAEFDTLAEQLWQLADEQDIREPSGTMHSLHFHRVFSGYSTADFSDETAIKTTLIGRQVLSGQLSCAPYQGLIHALTVEALPSLLELALSGVDGGSVREQLPLARAQIDMLVLWSIKQGLLQTIPRKDICRSNLLFRYQRRLALRQAQGLKCLLQRLQTIQQDQIETITPLSDQGYWSCCLIRCKQTEPLLYQPFYTRYERFLYSKKGLLANFNSVLPEPLFALDEVIYTAEDRYGDYGFRSFVSSQANAITPVQLGRLSACLLLLSVTDLGHDNLAIRNNTVALPNVELSDDQLVVWQCLINELSGDELPPQWSASSLCQSGIERLWCSLVEKGYELNALDAEQVIAGFVEALMLLSEHASLWLPQLQRLITFARRYEPVSSDMAKAVLKQVSQYDVKATDSLGSLKGDLRIQAQRSLRQAGVEENTALVEDLVAHWLRGESMVIRKMPTAAKQNEAKEIVTGLFTALKQENASTGIIWLATLYREWLLHFTESSY